MSPFSASRPGIRAPSIIALSVLLVSISLVWASRQQAGTPSLKSAVPFAADKQGITPQASTITVNSLSDVANSADGLCTLREAITAANSNVASGGTAGECAAGSSAGTDTINVTVNGTIDLTGVLPDLSSDMSINGPGSSLLTVRRNTGGEYRIFSVTGGTVTMAGLTATNGKSSAGLGNAEGGGIRNTGVLTLIDVGVTSNAAATGVGAGAVQGAPGGGIWSSNSLTMMNCVVSQNHAGNGSANGAGGNGGGIAASGTLSMTNCSINGNAAGGATFSGTGGSGGGVYSTNTLTITNCIIDGNSAGNGGSGGHGGGIYAGGASTLTRITISNNVAGDMVTGSPGGTGGSGGGIYVGGSIAIINSTIDTNRAGNSLGSSFMGQPGDGGGIYNHGANFLLSGSTVSNNTSPGTGGGISNNGTSRLENTTISGNTASTGGGGVQHLIGTMAVTSCTISNNSDVFVPGFGGGCTTNHPVVRNTLIAGNNGADVDGGCFNSDGHNLIGNRGGSAFGFTNGVNGDQVGTSGSVINAQLGPLASNGGPTKTHALLSNSPALDAGDNCVSQAAHCGDPNISQLLTDQRGTNFNRIVDGPDVDSTATVDIGAYEMQVTLANLPDTSTNEDTQLLVPFDAGDASTVTSVIATSGDPTLVPNDPAHLSVTMAGSTGLVTINPDTNANGGSFITITVNRTGGGSDVKSFMLVVNPVNDAPSFLKGADQIVNEDAGAQTIGWATNISPGPNTSSPGPNESTTQTVTFTVTNDNNGLFSAQPAVSATGTLTYTPAANANGVANVSVTLKDNGGTANGGVDTSASQTFTITVNPINDVPSFTKGADQTINEDAGAQTVTNWATNISAGAANESGQTLSFQITNNTNAALFSVGPIVSSTGILTYTPASNANGSATISLLIKDNGGTANGGVDTSAAQTFTITVNSVNDAPSFTKGANQTVNEDAGGQTVNNWATVISAGPADEAGQTLTFQVTNNTNTSLFSAGPSVSSAGTLTYTPAANANGSATITINLKDSGGTANGGVDTSASQTFTITVNAVNDVPSFTKGADQTVNNNAGAQSVANWATNILRGPSDESGQTLTFQITGNTNSGLFSAGPAVSSTGTLTYTPSTSAGGTATITINLRDSGGTANGGVDTSASQTFNITVVPVNGFVNFASSTANTTENSGSTTVNVVRTGDTSNAVTVNYATNADAGVPCSTANGVASPKCDFTAAFGTLNFAAGETSKPITILISQDSFVEGPEAITLTLSSPTNNAALGTPSSMSLTIADDASEPPGNIIDDANTFVRMHYHDFLNREADQSGLDFWTGQMTNCGNSDLTVCRVNVSGAFFLSIEFQQTGYLVERMYKTGYGDATGMSTIGGSHQIFVPVVRANEFLADTQRIGRGVVVLQPGWETVLENNKQAYALEFVQTPRFISAFPTSRTPAQFVDQLNTNAGGVLSVSERQTAINLFGNAVNTTNVNARAQALRQVAEDSDLYNAEFNRAFVLTQFIGYLRRNPNDAPDADYTGYDFWLGKLNQFNGDYIAAEMVKAFISSSEYRQRFGQ